MSTTDEEKVEAMARAIREAPIRQGIGMKPMEPDPDVPLTESDYARARAALAVVREREGWHYHFGAIAARIDDELGRACDDFDPDCTTCRAWQALNELARILCDTDPAPPPGSE